MWIVLAVGGLLLTCVVGGIVMAMIGNAAINAIPTDSQAAAASTRATQPEASNLHRLQVEHPAGKFIVRGKCKLTTDFFFSGKQATHYSVMLHQYKPDALFWCYIARESDDGKRLVKLLGDGDDRMLTLECEFDKVSTDHATMHRVLQWE